MDSSCISSHTNLISKRQETWKPPSHQERQETQDYILATSASWRLRNRIGIKNISQIEHLRHRSFTHFFINLVCGLLAYCHQEKKPSLKLTPKEQALLADAQEEGAMIVL